MNMAMRHGVLEIRLLFRRKTTAFAASVLPIGLCVMTWFTVRNRAPESWGSLVSDRFVMLMLLSVFMTSMTVYTARRQSLVLKRLRTSELTDAGVITAITMPVVTMGVAQVLVYVVFCLFVGAPVPTHPWLLLLGLASGLLMTVAAGMAIAAVSRSVEATPVTAFPVIVATLAGLFMQDAPDAAVVASGVMLPLIGPADLVAKGWSGYDAGATLTSMPPLVLGLASTLLWAAVFAAVIARFFRWEPRA